MITETNVIINEKRSDGIDKRDSKCDQEGQTYNKDYSKWQNSTIS